MKYKEHTQGEWGIKMNTTKTFNITDSGDFKNVCRNEYQIKGDLTICRITSKVRHSKDGIDEQAEANAKLISAAPALLDSLLELTELDDIHLKVSAATFIRIKNAIKQATE